MVSNKKIAMLGLDNAGKTSILTAMKKKFDVPQEVRGLKPTLKVERSSFQFMGHIINQADFGGQKKYRDEYLEHTERYLSAIDLIYFVIDIQDSLRFEESIDYLKDLLTYFEQNEEFIPVMIMFHKADPKISSDPTIQSNIEQLQAKLDQIDERFSISYHITNIFEIHTVIRAFSRGIAMLYNQNETIQRFLYDIVEKMENVMALLLFEQNGIELGTYFLDNVDLKMRKKILTLYEIAQRRIVDDNRNMYEFSDRLDAFTKISGVIQSFEINEMYFFILLILEEHDEEIVVEQFNFFENSYTEIFEILSAILKEE